MRTVFHSADGIGDICLVTAVAHNYFEITGKKMLFCSLQKEIWQNNPYVSLRFSFLYKRSRFFLLPIVLRLLGYRYVNLSFTGKRTLANGCEVDYLLPYNMVLSLSLPFIVPGRYLVTPEFFLTAEEKKVEADASHRKIVFNWNGLQEYKTWDFAKASRLASWLAEKGYDVIQTGKITDRLLPNVIDYRGKTTIRHLASLLYNARLYIGPIGGCMHVARSVGCPSVILFSGAESESQFDYDFKYVVGKDCSFCKERQFDPYSMCVTDCVCTRNISLEDVQHTVEEELSKEYHRLPPVTRTFSQSDIDVAKQHFSDTPSGDVFKISLETEDFFQKKHFFAGVPETSPSFLSNRELKGDEFTLRLTADYIYQIGKIYLLDQKYHVSRICADLQDKVVVRKGYCVRQTEKYLVWGDFRTEVDVVIKMNIPPGVFGIRIDCSALPKKEDKKEIFVSIAKNSPLADIFLLLKIAFKEVLFRAFHKIQR